MTPVSRRRTSRMKSAPMPLAPMPLVGQPFGAVVPGFRPARDGRQPVAAHPRTLHANSRAAALALLAVSAVLSLACSSAPQPAPQSAVTQPAPAQPAQGLATTVHMGDPKSAGQLIAGFYGIEAGAWRWTGKQFAVELGTPYGAAAKGAAVEFKLSIPAVVIEKSKSVTLTASADGTALPPETYSAPGAYTYHRDLPPALLAHDSVKVTFTLDKTFHPGGGDLRELGVVASSVALK